jgi:hypothetical protein
MICLSKKQLKSLKKRRSIRNKGIGSGIKTIKKDLFDATISRFQRFKKKIIGSAIFN